MQMEKKLCYLLGDYDINLFNCGSYNLTSEFIDVMWSFSFLAQKINKNSASLIDNIFTNNYNIFYVFLNKFKTFMIIITEAVVVYMLDSLKLN